MLFTDFQNSKYFLRYSRSKSETTTVTLWEVQTKTAKIDYFTKNLSPPRFFEINASNFQEMFLDIFRKFCRKKLRKYVKSCLTKNKEYVYFEDQYLKMEKKIDL